jgi:primosomal replication protein N
LSGKLLERGALRYTPAGIPALEFRLTHVSGQQEADAVRRVECEIPCVALGQTALLLQDANPGDGIVAGGFLAAKSTKNRSLVLHVTNIEFVEGTSNGIQT